MTKGKPKRDDNGKFLPRGQTSRGGQRPDTPPASGERGSRPDAPPMHHCRECGSEFEYTRVLLYGMDLDIGSCPRCRPDPLSRILEMGR